MFDVYYAEDDEAIARTVSAYLEKRGYRVVVFPTIAEAKEALRRHCPALVLADWHMPDGEGDAFVRWIRSGWKELPLIFLTVRGDSRDIVRGFQNGADDYVVKPFSLEVLFSRMEALLRRTGNVSGQYLSCGTIFLDRESRLVRNGGEEVALGVPEYELLLYLLRHQGRTVTRETLLAKIWDCGGNYVNDNTLTVTMKRLREKLQHPPCLKTVRSVGYRMEDAQ